jgi:hypothetical protein
VGPSFGSDRILRIYNGKEKKTFNETLEEYFDAGTGTLNEKKTKKKVSARV